VKGVNINGPHEAGKNQEYALNVKALIGIDRGGRDERSKS